MNRIVIGPDIPTWGTWTVGQEYYVVQHYSKTPISAICSAVGHDHNAVKDFASMLGLKPFVKHKPATVSELKFIRDNYLKMPTATMSRILGRHKSFAKQRLEAMGLVVPRELVERFRLEGQIKPGNVPRNKGKKQVEYMSPEAIERTMATRFQKGIVPKNTLEDNDITVRQDHPERGGAAYKYIRISKARWEPLHVHIWKEINGSIPKGHCLWFIDGDTMNCTIENLELITRAENTRRNTIHNYPEDLKKLIMTKGYLKRTMKKIQQ